MKELKKLYHVSMDLEVDKKKFTPRIPKYRCKNENDSIDRICVCPTLEEAIGAFPYKSILVNNMDLLTKYLSVYEFNTDNYMDANEIAQYVPDVHLTNEHWVLNEHTIKPKIIKINNLKLSHYNKYINEEYGYVKECDYEYSVENYDRECEYIILSKYFLKRLFKIAKAENIKVDILEDEYAHLRHYKGYNSVTTKRYRWIKVKLFVPKGSDLSQIWILDNKQQLYFRKKEIFIEKNTVRLTDEEFYKKEYEEWEKMMECS